MNYKPTLINLTEDQIQKLEHLNVSNKNEVTNEKAWVARFNRSIVAHLKETEESLELVINNPVPHN